MKRAILVKLGVLLVPLLLVGITAQMAKAQEDTTIVTDTLYSTSEIDGGIWYSQYYSTLFVNTIAGTYSAGDGWDWITGGENYVRSYLSFDLSSLPDSIIVREATVKLYQFHSIGDDTGGRFPVWDVPGGDTLFCIMDHIDYGAYLDTSDWGAGNPGHPKTLTSNIGVISDDTTIEYKTLDVTRYVQADIDDGRKRSQFRIRFPIDTDHDERDDRLEFYWSRTTPPPYVLITYRKQDAVREWGDYSLPVEFDLEQNFPNPFNASTTVRYTLPQVIGERFKVKGGPNTSRLIPITLKIYNILGKEVRRLVSEEQRVGRYEVVWDGKDEQGKDLASGVYFCKLEYGGFIAVRKLVLLR